jgi:hypothetical protein
MIRALGGDRADPVLILGLSDENWRRLRAGQPISVDLGELEPGLRTGRVLLLAGETEAAIMDDLRAHLGAENVSPPEYRGEE